VKRGNSLALSGYQELHWPPLLAQGIRRRATDDAVSPSGDDEALQVLTAAELFALCQGRAPHGLVDRRSRRPARRRRPMRRIEAVSLLLERDLSRKPVFGIVL
jgi:hypothetical protein